MVTNTPCGQVTAVASGCNALQVVDKSTGLLQRSEDESTGRLTDVIMTLVCKETPSSDNLS